VLDIRPKTEIRARLIDNLLRQIASSPGPTMSTNKPQLSSSDILMASGYPESGHSNQSLAITLPSEDPCRVMKEILEEVDVLESKTIDQSKATNWEYWKLGDAYHQFCLVSTR